MSKQKYQFAELQGANVDSPSSNVTLTSNSLSKQILTPSTDIDVNLPSTDVQKGRIFEIHNEDASNLLTIKSSSGNEIYPLNKGKIVLIAKQDTPTSAAHWYRDYLSTERKSLTPVLTFGANTQTLTINVSGWYRVNNIVFVEILIRFTRSGTGDFKITLPSELPLADTNSYAALSVARFDRFTPTNRIPFFRINGGTREITGITGGGDTFDFISDSNVSTSVCSLQLTGSYFCQD